MKEIGALKDAPELQVGRNKATAVGKERLALIGYVRGNLCPNDTYVLAFGLQRNDRPVDANAVRLLAASMDGATERYSSRSFIKIPISPALLTAENRAKIEKTRTWNLDTLYENPEQVEELCSLEMALEDARRELGDQEVEKTTQPGAAAAGPSGAASTKAVTAMAGQVGAQGSGEDVEMAAGQQDSEDVEMAEGKQEPLDKASEDAMIVDANDKRVVLRPCGGQHRTEALRQLLDEYEVIVRKRGEKLYDTRNAIKELRTTLEQEHRESPGKSITELSSYTPFENLRQQEVRMEHEIARRQRFIEDGGSWLFALYDDSK